MKVLQVLGIAILFSAVTIGDAFAVNLAPGDYEIKTWQVSPKGGTGRIETRIEHVAEPEALIAQLHTQEKCEQLSRSMVGNILKFELKCAYTTPVTISGQLTFKGNSFEGKFRYSNASGEMATGMRGTKIEAIAKKTPAQEPAKKVDDIDRKLRELWKRMDSYMCKGDIEKAVELFHPDARRERRIVFENLKDVWPAMMKEVTELRRVKIDDRGGHAIYSLTTREKEGEFAYEVVFQKDQDDKWYIVDF